MGTDEKKELRFLNLRDFFFFEFYLYISDAENQNKTRKLVIENKIQVMISSHYLT